MSLIITSLVFVAALFFSAASIHNTVLKRVSFTADFAAVALWGVFYWLTH